MKVDFEQFGVDTIEQGTLLQNKAVKGVVTLPSVPNYYQLNSGPWAKYQGVGQNVLVNAVYKFDYGFRAVLAVGRSESRKDDRSLGQLGTYNIVTGVGKETLSLIDNQDYVNIYAKGELKNHYQYSFLTNDVTFGVNRNERDFNGPATGSFVFAQNIYNPTPGPTPPSPSPSTYLPQNSYDNDFYVEEDVGLFNRIHLLGGVREINYTFNTQLASGSISSSVFNTASPAFGVVVGVVPGIEVYASYLKALQETGEAPQSASNQFQIQPPAEGTQKEVGIRATNLYNATATLAAFRIDQANAITDAVTNVFGINGTQTLEGLEGTLRYKIFPSLVDLTFVSGGQLGSSIQHSTDPTINNMEAENIPRVSGNAGLVYRPGFVNGLTVNGGALFTGSRELDNLGQGKIPAVTIFNLGGNYVTAFEGHRVTYNITCQNLLDKSYYSSAVNGALGVGRPRTIFFGGRVDF
jgi:iron complex outermembrane receptor protein